MVRIALFLIVQGIGKGRNFDASIVTPNLKYERHFVWRISSVSFVTFVSREMLRTNATRLFKIRGYPSCGANFDSNADEIDKTSTTPVW